MIHVVQVVSDTNIGGAGRYLLNYVKHFDREKFCVTVLIPEDSMLKSPLSAFRDIRVIEVPYMKDKTYDKRCVLAMREILRREPVDILHTHASLSARIAARLEKVPCVISTRHCIEPKGNALTGFVKSVLNNYLCDYYVAVSDKVAENLKECHIKKRKIRTVYNGVEAVMSVSDNEKEEIKNRYSIINTPVFGIFARLEPVKGHRYFIEAAKAYVDAGFKGTFLVVGDGTLKESLVHQAEGYPDIRFLGYVQDTKELLNITDINVITSESEAMSLAILEAMSLKKPTIATNVGGNPELIRHEENGLLTEYANVYDLKNAFIKFGTDKTLYEKCAENAGMLYSAKFTAEIMTKHLEKLYEEAHHEKR